AFAGARAVWQAEKERIQSLFGSGATWANQPYNLDDAMARAFTGLEACFSEGMGAGETLQALELFTSRAIAAGTSKRGKAPAPAPTHAFFQRCDAIATAEHDFLIGLQVDFFHFAKAELPRRLSALKLQSFEDLLTGLHQAL